MKPIKGTGDRDTLKMLIVSVSRLRYAKYRSSSLVELGPKYKYYNTVQTKLLLQLLLLQQL